MTARGFTLLEALVVLAIAGLVAAVMIQGFGTVLAVRQSVAANVDDLRRVVLERNVIVDPLTGLIPDYKDAPGVFRGGRQSLEGLTIRPLNGPAGTPRPFRLSLEYDRARNETVLRYLEEPMPSQDLARWPGDVGSFAYRDISGDWVEAWPPLFDENAPQTPWLVRLSSGLASNPVMIAYVASPHERAFRIEDLGMPGMDDDRAP
ncbi:MAG: prepilin-type N-terminal cleavage/methylation domain-containing protein [Rhodospirillaceae bacterium]|nr:prepilin-type N-terminal cleavage/methylation domain-containing protein [Rhodospirillaceae bacterium]